MVSEGGIHYISLRQYISQLVLPAPVFIGHLTALVGHCQSWASQLAIQLHVHMDIHVNTTDNYMYMYMYVHVMYMYYNNVLSALDYRMSQRIYKCYIWI